MRQFAFSYAIFQKKGISVAGPPDTAASLHRLRRRQNARARHAGFRLAATTVRVLFAFALLLCVRVVWTHLTVAFARANFPFSDNQWAEGPLMLQLWRFTQGQPLYGPMGAADAYDYGPGYLVVLSSLRAALHLPFGIVTVRWLSIAITLLSLVPLTGIALLLARRVGITRERPLPYWVAIGATVLLGIATLTSHWSFDAIHPDALLVLLLASGIWLYAAIADRILSRRWVWLLMVVFIVALLTKANAAVIFPILVFGLVLDGVLNGSALLTFWGIYLAGSLLALMLLPPDMRQWTFFGPLHQPYEMNRWPELSAFAFWYKPYVLALPALMLASLFVIKRRPGGGHARLSEVRSEAARPFSVDLPILIAVGFAGLGAFFKRGGGWTDLAILPDICVPYAAVTLAYCSQPIALKRTAPLAAGAVVATFVLAVFALGVPIRPAPSYDAYLRMGGARDTAAAICASGRPTLVTAFPDLFFGCKNVQFALAASWGEARNSYWYTSDLTTRLDDDPHIDQVVWLNYHALYVPLHPWLYERYQLVASIPIVVGHVYEYYAPDATLELWRRKPSL